MIYQEYVRRYRGAKHVSEVMKHIPGGQGLVCLRLFVRQEPPWNFAKRERRETWPGGPLGGPFKAFQSLSFH